MGAAWGLSISDNAEVHDENGTTVGDSSDVAGFGGRFSGGS
jgi:hypothetical protein